MKFITAYLLLVVVALQTVRVMGQSPSMALEAPDLLPASFHAERRQAFRDLMPANSVAVVFAYPERNFSNDVNYVFHQNPNLYYLSGYMEPDAMLLIFKDMQTGADNSRYNEVMFVRKRNAQREQWTGRRLGVEGTKSKLGFSTVFNGEDFTSFPINFSNFSSVLFDVLPGSEESTAAGDLAFLMNAFKAKMGMDPHESKAVQSDLLLAVRTANTAYYDRVITRIASRKDLEAYRNNAFVTQLLSQPNEEQLKSILQAIAAKYAGMTAYSRIMGQLREIKTPAELNLLRKSVEISSLAHIEAMRAITPRMSERELDGIYHYMHKRYGAEDEGYPPIVGAGQNGCILHYIENSAPQVENQLLLADVGSEYHGYSADVTRTFPANGKFTAEQKAIYQLVYDAQEEIFKLCKQGVPFASLNEKAKEVLGAGLIKLGIISNPSDVSKYYMHGCSHHLGLDVHDKSSSNVLQENMVITVEPGIYIAKGSPCDPKWWDIGVRIEDDVVIGKQGCENLSKSAPRSIEAIEKLLAEKSLFNQFNFPALSIPR